jgi:hypothetical protein
MKQTLTYLLTDQMFDSFLAHNQTSFGVLQMKLDLFMSNWIKSKKNTYRGRRKSTMFRVKLMFVNQSITCSVNEVKLPTTNSLKQKKTLKTWHKRFSIEYAKTNERTNERSLNRETFKSLINVCL